MRLQVGRQRRSPHQRAGCQDVATALKGVVAAGHLVHLLDRRPHRDVDILPRLVQRLPRQGHPMLPADQPADAAHGRVHDPQSLGIARTPDKALRVGGHQLAVVVEQPAVRPEGEQGVVEGAASRAAFHALAHPYHQGGCGVACDGGQRIHGRARNGHAILGQAREDRLDRRVVPERDIAADVQPGRVAGEPRLGEDDQLSS